MSIPQILKNLLNSEKAVASALPLIIATVFVFTGKITYQQWMDFAEVITGIYVGGKTIHGAAVAMSAGKAGGKDEVEALKARLAATDAAADAALKKKFAKEAEILE